MAKNFFHRTFSSLKIRNYRLYFIGQAISLSGTWMQTVAQGWLVLQLTHSGTQLGAVVALQFLPVLLAGPWGGLAADRWDKRTVLLITQTVLGLLALGLGIVVLTGVVRIWMLYVFAAVLGIARVFDDPARHAFISELVDADRVKNAVSLNATANNLARAIGPSLGGIIIAGFGIAFCFLVNACSFLATIVMLYRMRPDELHIHYNRRSTAALHEGFRYVLSEPNIGMILLMMAVIGTFAYEFQVSLPLFAERVFHGGAGSYAALMAVMGAGATLGGLFAAGRERAVPHHLVIFAVLLGVTLCITSLMPTLELAIMGMFIEGFFSINLNTLANTMLQLGSIPEMRGRVMSFWTMAMMGSTPIGGFMIGYIGEHAGVRWALGVGGSAAILAALFATPRLLKKDTPERIPESVHIETEEIEAENLKA